MFLTILMMIDNDSDRAYMESLYMKHRHVMYVVAFSILRDTHDVEDAISCAIIRLMPKINVIRELESFKMRAYIVTTIKRVAYDMLARRKMEVSTDFDGIEMVENRFAAEDINIANVGNADEIARVLKQLPERERMILLMKYEFEWKDEQISRAIGVKEDSVRTIINRIRKHVRDILTKERAKDEQE